MCLIFFFLEAISFAVSPTTIDQIVPPQTFQAPDPGPLNSLANDIGSPCNEMITAGVQTAADYANAALVNGSKSIFTDSNPLCPLIDLPLEIPCNNTPLQQMNNNQLSCSMSRDSILSIVNSNKAGMCNAQCQLNKAKQVSALLACVSKDSQKMNTLLRTVGKSITDNITKQQTQVQNALTVISDRKTQLSTLDNFLNGDQDAGTPGLVATQKNLQAAMNAMPGAIAQVKALQIELQKAQKSYDATKQSRITNLSMSCLSTMPQSQYRCSAYGPAVTYMEYISCYFGSQSRIASNGQVQQSGLATTNAQSTSSQITSILQNMVNAGNASTASSSGQSSGPMRSVDQLINSYASGLSSYSSSGGSALDMLKKFMQTCQANGTAQAQTEESNPSSELGAHLTGIQTAQNNLTSGYTDTLSTVTKELSNATQTLYQSGTNINASTCMSVGAFRYGEQLSCLASEQKNLQSVLYGNNANPSVFSLPGSAPNSSVTISCVGVQACVAQLQGQKKLFTQDFNNYQQAVKEIWPQRSASQMDDFIKGITLGGNTKYANLSLKSQALQDQVNRLNLGLTLLGGTSVSLPPVKGEDFQTDANGMRLPPKDAVSLLGGHMNPPMPDVSSSAFAQMQSAANSAVLTQQNNIAAVGTSLNNAEFFLSSCHDQQAQQVLNSLPGQDSELACREISQHCTQGTDEYHKAHNALSALRRASNINPFANQNQMQQNNFQNQNNFANQSPAVLFSNMQNSFHAACEDEYPGAPHSADPAVQSAHDAAAHTNKKKCQQFFSGLISSGHQLDQIHEQFFGHSARSAK